MYTFFFSFDQVYCFSMFSSFFTVHFRRQFSQMLIFSLKKYPPVFFKQRRTYAKNTIITLGSLSTLFKRLYPGNTSFAFFPLDLEPKMCILEDLRFPHYWGILPDDPQFFFHIWMLNTIPSNISFFQVRFSTTLSCAPTSLSGTMLGRKLINHPSYLNRRARFMCE